MSEPSRLADLTWAQVQTLPQWEQAPIEGRIQIANEYHADIASYFKEVGEDSEEKMNKLNELRRGRIFTIAPSLKQPEDIGAMENFSNAFQKTIGSMFKENIYFNLLEQNPEEAMRYRRGLERALPTREGFSGTMGAVTANVIPTGLALLAAPVTGGTSFSAVAALGVGMVYGASSAGAAYGDIYREEQRTGEDVGDLKTAAVMAGHAAAEIAFEMLSLRLLTGIGRGVGSAIGMRQAETLGRSIFNRIPSETTKGLIDSFSDFARHNKTAAFALGWAGAGGVEAIEEGFTQVAQNITDKLYKESPTMEGVVESMYQGSLGGLLLGPLAMGVQAMAGTKYRTDLAGHSRVALDEAIKAKVFRETPEDQMADMELRKTKIAEEYAEVGDVDETGFANPDFMFLKEFVGMAGIPALPILGTPASRSRGLTFMKGADGNPMILVNMTYAKEQGGGGMMAAVLGHEFAHAAGLDVAVATAIDLTNRTPVLQPYQERLAKVQAGLAIGNKGAEQAARELVADVFGQVWLNPSVLDQMVESVSANKAVAKTTINWLRDNRGRLERMGRKIDALMASSEAAGVTTLPRAAMEAARTKISDQETLLDQMIGKFSKGFENAIVQAAKPPETAPIVAGDEEPAEDLLGSAVDVEAAPVSPDIAAPDVTPETLKKVEAETAGLEDAPFSPAEHGTPHVFAPEPGFPHGRFRLDKIGTGEGAQAYGRGIYFAENPEVAKGYSQLDREPTREELRSYFTPGRIVRGYAGMDRVIRFNEDEREWSVTVVRVDESGAAARGEKERTHATRPVIKEVMKALGQSTSSIYRLDIPDEAIPMLLDWDKPLSEQTEHVRSALAEILPDADPQATGEVLHHQAGVLPFSPGNDWQESAAYNLRRAGIPGLKYLDGESRPRNITIRKRMGATAADTWYEVDGLEGTFKTREEAHAAVEKAQTHNYVIWDQGLLDRITLLARNGKALDAARAEEGALLSPAEGAEPTPYQNPSAIFDRAFNPKTGEFYQTEDGKYLDSLLRAKGGTSRVVEEMFLKPGRRIVPAGFVTGDPGVMAADTPAARLLRERFNRLPEWVKLKSWEPARERDLLEWSPDGLRKAHSEALGLSGVDAAETYLGFVQDLEKDAEGKVSEDAVMEVLQGLVEGVKSRADMRAQNNARVAEELKNELNLLALRKLSPILAARRITRSRMRMYQPKDIQRLVTEPKMNLKTAIKDASGKSKMSDLDRLVEQGDLRPGDVVRQRDNLYFVEAIAPDRVPVMRILRGVSPFDDTIAYEDNPMDDPDVAESYRFGMEEPPVERFYAVQAVFPVDMSEEAQRMVEEGPVDRGEMFSPAEGAADSEYFKAVEAGDMATAQRIVDEAARKAGYYLKVYHGGTASSSFDTLRGERSTKHMTSALGSFFSETEAIAEQYGKTNSYFIEDLNLLDISFKEASQIETVEKAREYRNFAEANGYDGFILDAGKNLDPDRGMLIDREFVILNPTKIKSAAPITRDDQGNIIPPSKRFNQASDDTRFSPAEGTTPGDLKTQIDSFLLRPNEIMRDRYDSVEITARAHAILHSGGADTFDKQLLNLKKADEAGMTYGVKARYLLMWESGNMRVANLGPARVDAYFGTSDKGLQDKKVMEAELEYFNTISLHGKSLELGQTDETGARMSYTEMGRLTYWHEMMAKAYNLVSGRDVVNRSMLAKLRTEEMIPPVRDALDDLIKEWAKLPASQFNPVVSDAVSRARVARLRARSASRKMGETLLSAAEGAAVPEDLLSRIFGPAFGSYYAQLGTAKEAELVKALTMELDAETAREVIEEMKEHAKLFPHLLTDQGKMKGPAVVGEIAEDLLEDAEEDYARRIEKARGRIYGGEVAKMIEEKVRQRLPKLKLDSLALSATMTPEEQEAEIDKAMAAMAKTLLDEAEADGRGAGVGLTVEGIAAHLAPLADLLKARAAAFVTLSSAVNTVMKEMAISIQDVLRISQEKAGYVSQDIAGAVAERAKAALMKLPGMEENPAGLAAAVERVREATSQYLTKSLKDAVDEPGNPAMRVWNKARDQARRLVSGMLKLFYGAKSGPVEYQNTAKGLAATLLADPKAYQYQLEVAFQEANRKGESLYNDVIGEIAEGLGLPRDASQAEIKAKLKAKPIPDGLAERAVAEHMRQTGRSLADMADVTNPMSERIKDVVAELTLEFGPTSEAVWRETLDRLIFEKRAAAAERMLKPKPKKGAKPAPTVLDKFITALAGGQIDDPAMMQLLAEASGLPALRPEIMDELKAAIAVEVEALRTYGPNDAITYRAGQAVADILARDFVYQAQNTPGWKLKGRVTEAMLKSMFYSGALSGFRTWGVTNPTASAMKTLQTMLENVAKNALKDPVLKQQGFKGALAAMAFALRQYNLDPVRLATREGLAPQSIERKLSLDNVLSAKGAWEVLPDDPSPIKMVKIVWGLAAKYVPRLIMAGDAISYHPANAFGSYEAARRIVLTEANATGEKLTLAETQKRVFEKLALGPDGKPTAAQHEQARKELKDAGQTPSDHEIRMRAVEIAKRERADIVNEAGAFIGEQSTFTNPIGVHYIQEPGDASIQEANWMKQLLDLFLGWKQSKNMLVSGAATIIVPFPSIAMRILDQSFNYVVFPGLLRWQSLREQAGRAKTDGEKARLLEGADLQLVRVIEGTAFLIAMTLLAVLSADEDEPWFKLTGAGPSDFRKNAQWREAGGRPNTLSVKLPGMNEYVTLNYLASPLAPLLFSAGTVSDAMRFNEPEDQAGVVTTLVAGFVQSTFEQSFMSSVADVMDILAGRDEAGAQQKLYSLVANPLATMAVPFAGAVRNIDQMINPYPVYGRVDDNPLRTFVRTLASRLPLAGFGPGAKLNALGQPVENDRPLEADLSLGSWRRGKVEAANKVFDWVVEKRAWLPTPHVAHTWTLPPESALTKQESRRLANEENVLMDLKQYKAFMARRGELAIEMFREHDAELRAVPAGEPARAVAGKIMELASNQAKREMAGLRPLKRGVRPDLVIREAIKKAVAEAEE